jgi:voltage-gated sodium channel
MSCNGCDGNPPSARSMSALRPGSPGHPSRAKHWGESNGGSPVSPKGSSMVEAAEFTAHAAASIVRSLDEQNRALQAQVRHLLDHVEAQSRDGVSRPANANGIWPPPASKMLNPRSVAVQTEEPYPEGVMANSMSTINSNGHEDPRRAPRAGSTLPDERKPAGKRVSIDPEPNRGTSKENSRDSRVDMADVHLSSQGTLDLRSAEDQKKEEELDKKVQEQLAMKMGVSAKAAVLGQGVIDNMSAPQLYVHNILSTTKFDAVIGLVICANSITVGMQSTYEINGWSTTPFMVIEWIFLVIYSTELGLRFFAHGKDCLKSGWVCFDLFLVSTSLISMAIVEPILKNSTDEGSAAALGSLMVLRMFRLGRLARAIRLIAQFRTLWTLVRGLFGNIDTVMYTFILIFIILYIFACMGIELITKSPLKEDDEVWAELVELHFSSLWLSMLTLVQFVTLDSVGAIYAPMIQRSYGLAVYFLLFILFVSIALMNLVTAVIVEGSLASAETDKEVQRAYKHQMVKALIPKIRSLFVALDTDGDGTVTLDECVDAPESVKKELNQVIQTEDIKELFEMLDSDNDGSLGIDEFCDAIQRIAVSDIPPEQLRMRNFIEKS